MKKAGFAIVLVVALVAFAGAVVFVTLAASADSREALRPVVAREFGKPIVVKAEFVSKENDYHSQNIVKERYALRVLEAEGQALKRPVTVEYLFEASPRLHAEMEKPGVVREFEAYETLYQPSISTPWPYDGMQTMGFALIHKLHIRPKLTFKRGFVIDRGVDERE